MNIMIFNTLYSPNQVGGAEKSVQVIAESLVNQNHNVFVITLSTKKPQVQELVNGVRVFYLEPLSYSFLPTNKKRTYFQRIFFQMSSDFFDGKVYSQMKEIIKGLNPDVFYVNNLAGLSTRIHQIASTEKIPIVHTLRDYFQVCIKQSMYHKNNVHLCQCPVCKVLTFKRRIYSNKVSAVVGNSQYILDRHLNSDYFKNADYKSVVFNGFDRKPVLNSINEKSSDMPVRFGFIGQITEEKGIAFLLESLYQFKFMDFELVIAGDDTTEYVSKLKKTYFDFTKITWLGWSDTDSFFSRIDFLIVPSLWPEPLARVVFESYFYGVPVISSDRGGNKEIIKDDVTGWVYSAGSVNSFNEVFNKAVNSNVNLYTSMSKNCYKYSTEFHSKNTVNKYSEIFRKVVQK